MPQPGMALNKLSQQEESKDNWRILYR